MTRLTRRPCSWCPPSCASVSPAFADQAKTLYDKGAVRRGARQNYEQAYDFTNKRTRSAKDLKYRSSYERNRFLSAASHVHRARSCGTPQARRSAGGFQKAIEIDPSSFIAQQDMRPPQQ